METTGKSGASTKITAEKLAEMVLDLNRTKRDTLKSFSWIDGYSSAVHAVRVTVSKGLGLDWGKYDTSEWFRGFRQACLDAETLVVTEGERG